MKHLLFFVLFLLTISNLYSQNKIKLRLNTNVNGTGDTVKLNTVGTTLKKGDNFVVYVSANGNNNTTTRQIYFDFEYQNTAYTLISIEHTGTGGNGGVLPSGASIAIDKFEYPGYKFTQVTNNTTSNGFTNYVNANYSFNTAGNHTIIRSNLTWASNSGMPYTSYWGLLKLTFKMNVNAVGFNYDPIRMNFGAGFNKNGGYDSTLMESPLVTKVYVDPSTESYVNASIDNNTNIDPFTLTRVAFYDTLGKTTYLVDATSDGKLAIDQTKLKANTVYKISARVNADVVKDIMNAAITVSDFTAAQYEFTRQNLDGTYLNNNIKTGVGYYSADVNQDHVFNGGDVTRLFAQIAALDSFYVLPATYKPGTDVYLDAPTFTDSAFNNMSLTSWKSVNDPYVYFKTGILGSNVPLRLKYVIPGDINRSHSSQVYDTAGIIQSNALVSLQTNTAIKSNSISSQSIFVNTTQEISSIDVSLNNATVTSNNIAIPITLDTKGTSVSALQFQFNYDPAKIKFEELQSSIPNSWFIFTNSKDGILKFGAIDKNLGTPIVGVNIPFTLKFSSINNGLDLTTSIKVSKNMDASDNKGNQLGINLNTTTIKLTGYNNF